jgi:ankyrin repeat protein
MLRKILSPAGIGVVTALCLTGLLMAAPGASPLADAAMRNDPTTVKTLLGQGADLNAAQNDGMTALHWAALNGDLAMTQVLLHAGANVNASTRIGGYTPLHVAAKNGHATIVEALLASGAHAGTADTYGTTPLMLAAASGSAEAVTTLVRAGADVNARESGKGETALMLAAANDRPAAMQVLLAHGADWRPSTTIHDWSKAVPSRPRMGRSSAGAGKSSENADAANGREGRGGADDANPKYPRLVGKQGGLTALLFAARHGYTGAVQVLLKGGADVNEVDPGDQTSALMIAIVNGHYDLAETLLAAGADPRLAQANGAAPLYGLLNCEWSPKADYPQPTAYKQQTTSYLTLMADLLAHGADPNARLKEKVWYTSYNRDYSGLDEAGATPFWRAAWADDVPAMKLLVAHGADPNVWTVNSASVGVYQTAGYGLPEAKQDMSGLAPVPLGAPDIPPLLAASGEEFGSSLTAGKLRFAPTGMLPAVKYLVEELHVDVNARDAKGFTALHNAASRGDNAMILYLVSKGADITAVNRRGQTVADMANGPFQRVNPFPETIALAKKLGAKLVHKCVSCGG